MAGLAERAELVARLSLQDNFSGKVRGAIGNLNKMEGSLGRIAGHANKGIKSAATNLAKIGAVAGGFVAFNVKQGIESLAELEDATTAVDGAIKQVGLTGKVTSAQVAGWANEIEANVQAAFDDKEIAAQAASLLRYGKVTEKNLRPALEVMTDLAAKTGSVESAGSLLAKALAAPEKAAGKLARVGVILTTQQEKQIKKMVKVGDVAGAQAVLLDALAESTKGAAAASKGPYNDALNTMRDSIEDVQRILGEGFLPVISKVADRLKKAAGDKGFMDNVREFGTTLAGAFDKAVEFAGNIPWGLIGSSLKTAGQGAKAVFDAFTMLPPWVQQAVITGWGLNKLTGGALGSIVGELGKGLIKGVLGMTAGVVNIKAGVVNGAAGGAGAGGGGIANTVGSLAAGAVVVEGVREGAGILAAIQTVAQSTDPSKVTTAMRTALNDSFLIPGVIRDTANSIINSMEQNLPTAGSAPVRVLTDHQDALRTQMMASLASVRDKAEANRIATVTAKNAIVSAGHSDKNALATVIRNNRPVINVRVPIAVYTNNGITRRVYSTGSSINNPSGPQE